ncbi:IclR family transcriptional regulator [Dactylosporangium sp. CA-092794]|uniref:IclR family transcriptional regulator n=1 Tax=Dactylosporangium sp. CA-092794 TaxID=3239929 RepID=UPI003D8D5815
MPTPVPAIDRAMQVLDLLAERPTEPMTLSDIARATGIHKATCASVLNTMTAHGLVHRDAARRYTVGSRLPGLGHAYARRFQPFVIGRPDVIDLVAETGLSCAVIVRDGDEVVVLDMLGNSRPAHLYMRIGSRVPLAPPVGTIFKAWAPARELDEWVDRMCTEFGGDRTAYTSSIAALRARGYSLGGEHDVHLELEAALRRVAKDPADNHVLDVALLVANKIRNYTTGGIDEDEPLNSVIGPVFNADSQVVMTLNLYGELGSARLQDLPRLVPPLLATANRITQKTGGVLPAGYSVDHRI